MMIALGGGGESKAPQPPLWYCLYEETPNLCWLEETSLAAETWWLDPLGYSSDSADAMYFGPT